MSEDTKNEKNSGEGKGDESEEGCASGYVFYESKDDDDYSTSEEDESDDYVWEDDHKADEAEFDEGYEDGESCTIGDDIIGVGESREQTSVTDESKGESSYSEAKEVEHLSVADTHPPPPPRKKRREK